MSQSTDKKSREEIQELRKFGLLVGGIFCFAFGLILPWALHRPFKLWPWIPGIPLFSLALIYPLALRVPHKIWMSLAKVLNWVNTRIILSFFYYGIFTPLSLGLKIMHRDPLTRNFDKNQVSYLVPTKGFSPDQMEKPF